MMRRVIAPVLILVGAACNGRQVCAQTIGSQEAMHARVSSLYRFSPHAVTDAVRDAKAKEMDAFWDEVKAHKDTDLPFLRRELDDASNPPFFFVDGSNLLMGLSESDADKRLVVRAMSRSDLGDVDSGAYFYVIHDLSVRGVDTTAAALHILDDPSFSVSVPAHAMTLNQQSSLPFLLLPVSETLWMDAARKRMATEKDEVAEKSLLALFFVSQTAEGDRVLRETAHDATRSEAIRKDAQEYLDDEKTALTVKSETKGSADSIREARRKRLQAVSDEAMDDVQDMTVRLIQLRAKAGEIKD